MDIFELGLVVKEEINKIWIEMGSSSFLNLGKGSVEGPCFFIGTLRHKGVKNIANCSNAA